MVFDSALLCFKCALQGVTCAFDRFHVILLSYSVWEEKYELQNHLSRLDRGYHGSMGLDESSFWSMRVL